ncbi:MAG: DUF1295 domain-containing protein [Acholeplasmataceae bacterium]|nr:DUF1295 domain-containing protein [Acholeplasmataceae bacterium]
MSKRTSSFLWILVIYMLSIGIGIFTFLMLDFSLLINLFIADVVSTVVIWIFSLILKNASLYDPYWSVIPPVMIILLMIYMKTNITLGVFLMSMSILLWSIRLTYNWARNWQGFHEVDWRYLKIKEKAPKLYPLTNLFGIQLMPTSIVFLQMILAIKILQAEPFVNGGIVIGALVIASGAIIQYIADQQMMTFRLLNPDKNKIIDFGLWKFSRHPNYFGEISVWWGLYLIYLSTYQVLDIFILPPILMTCLFLFISIPLMEKKILATRPSYMDYQKKVSMIIPFFHKKEK